jgi:membrane protease YdiL (CAAX protease family)
MEAYAEIMEASGLVDNVILTVVYGILLGPVIEELCLRGLCYGYLEKSGIKPFLVILISGLLFGIMHMNLVQGIYASVLGFFLGYLRYKYRSIKLTIAVHILFNLMGTYGSVAFDSLQLKEGAELILGGISLFILVFAVVLINGDKKAYRAE